MIGLLLYPAILIGVLYALARHDADIVFYKALLLTLALDIIGAVSFFVFAQAHLGILALPIVYFVCAWALVQFFCLQWGKSFLVTTVFIVLISIVGFLLSAGTASS